MRKKCVMLSNYVVKDRDAGAKAPKDVNAVFEQNFGKIYMLYHINRRYIRNILSWLNMHRLKNAFRDEYMFVQWPLYLWSPVTVEDILTIKSKKKVVLIHDIDSFRKYPDSTEKRKEEIQRLNKFDVVIAHNRKMITWLKENGLKKPCVSLELFDYLAETKPSQKKNTGEDNNYTICFAGNLIKSRFMQSISQYIHSPINIYGNKPDYILNGENLCYQGSYSPTALCEAMNGDFGLIWDGGSCEECSGNDGQYMKINNPHKLSLYISCGLPIITWKEAAIAEFIEKNGIGFAVNSLAEIDDVLGNMTRKEYEKYRNNVLEITRDVRKGEYVKKAFIEAISILEEERDLEEVMQRG